MKNTFAILGMGLATILLSSAAIAQKTSEAKDPKKIRHIKMMKIENGKKMELDTILNSDDVFVWNGDTLNPEKHINKNIDKMHRIDVEVEKNNGKENVRIFRHRGGNAGEPMNWKMDSGDDIQVFSGEEGDSIQKKIIIRKRINDGNDEDRLIYFNGPDMKHFPPRPPMPPHMKMFKGQNTGRVIDLNDPNIISYKKKNLSGDREKIEIVRKKSDGAETMTFDFDIDDAMIAPEPPEPPTYMNEENGRKIIRKEMKVEEKNDQKIEEENSPKENK